MSAKLNKEKLSPQQDKLIQEQLVHQGALEEQHREQRRQVDQKLKEELENSNHEIATKLDQQKTLVSMCGSTYIILLVLVWWTCFYTGFAQA